MGYRSQRPTLLVCSFLTIGLSWTVSSDQCQARGPMDTNPLSIQDIAEAYVRFRDGIPPNPTVALEEYRTFYANSQSITAINREILRDASKECRRYLVAVNRTFTQLDRVLTALKEPGLSAERKLLNESRLQLLVSLSSVLYRQAEAQREAGFGLLDPTQKSSCAMRDRHAWMELYVTTVTAANAATVAVMGVPGLSRMKEIERQLAASIVGKEQRDQRNFWLSMGGTILLSAIIWELFPLAGAYVFPTLGHSALAMWGLRVGGLTAEFMATDYVFDHYLFPEDRVLQARQQGVSWADLLKSTEGLLDTPLNSPRIYYDSLTRFYASWNGRMYQVLAPWESALIQLERTHGQVDRAFQVPGVVWR
jgi:hypothetical protein